MSKEGRARNEEWLDLLERFINAVFETRVADEIASNNLSNIRTEFLDWLEKEEDEIFEGLDDVNQNPA